VAPRSSFAVLALAASQTAALVLLTAPRAPRVARVRMQFDEEGGMVKEISEGGMSLEEVRANAGKETASLPAEKAEKLVLKEPEWNVAKMEVSATDEDFELSCNSMSDTEVVITIDPMMNTYEDYFYGLTADSHPSFKVVSEESSPIEGRMQRRGGDAEEVKIKCDPNGQSGEFVAYLCFILENEPDFSKFYKITCNSE